MPRGAVNERLPHPKWRIRDTGAGVYSRRRLPRLFLPCGGLPSMNQPPVVALVDPDPRGLATLPFSFEKERFTVAGTSDVGMARHLIQSTGARVPVVALGPPETRMLGLRAE